MPVLLCRCCGARLEIKPATSVVRCGYCGVQQTVPILGFDEESLLWERAEELRRNGEYDRAASIYEQIARKCPDEPDVYWSKVLCRYGVEYVEEPKSHRRIPTINRIQYTSVIDDEDYRKAVRITENAERAALRYFHMLQGKRQIRQTNRGFRACSRTLQDALCRGMEGVLLAYHPGKQGRYGVRAVHIRSDQLRKGHACCRPLSRKHECGLGEKRMEQIPCENGGKGRGHASHTVQGHAEGASPG